MVDLANNGSDRRRARILVADDSKTALMRTVLLLGGDAFDVTTAEDGEVAVEKALEIRPDVVLLDIMMPKLDGYEVCRRLRADDRTRNVPVIMITTRGEAENATIGYQAGCNDYVTKPVNGSDLLATIRRHLRR